MSSATSRPVGILANPLSGRDVRRLAARASTTTLESKRDQVARAVVGAVAGGAERVIVMREPFRVSSGAVENLRLDAKIEMLDVGARLAPEDTANAARAMREADCGAVLVLGGDGTNRIVAGAWPDAPLIPLSTGTNNVFPVMVEATVAGAAGGLLAAGHVELSEVARRAKLVRVEIEGEEDDLALIDAALLVDDRVGNFMPFEPERIRHVVLSRAEPDAVGVSPIGGLLLPCGANDDYGVGVRCGAPGEPGTRELLVPISPGLYRTVHVHGASRLEFGETQIVRGPGVLAFDGDRSRRLADGQSARLRIERDGPWVVDVTATLALGAERGVFVAREWHDAHDQPVDGDGGCC